MIEVILDTSAAPALAVFSNGDCLYGGQVAWRGRHSDRKLVPWIQEVLRNHGESVRSVDCWTVGTGPGSFSGLRVGIAFVRGVRLAAGARVRGLPSSLAAARTAARNATVQTGARIAVLYDARQGQIIVSPYRIAGTRVLREGRPHILGPDRFRSIREDYDIAVTQPGSDAVHTYLEKAGVHLPGLSPAGFDARELCDPPGWPCPETDAEVEASLQPIYVRPPVFVTPKPAEPAG